MLPTLYVYALCLALLAVGVWHIAAGGSTEELFKNPVNVRRLGIGLLVLSVPCFYWRGTYFWVAGVLLLLHGGFRAFFPRLNVRMQKGAYPRWVHGWIITSAAVVSALAFHFSWLTHPR
jgi:hypothetical protein